MMIEYLRVSAGETDFLLKYPEEESTLFIEYMLSQIDRILDDISVQIREDNEQLSECLKRLLEVMEYLYSQVAENWGLSVRRIQTLCVTRRIPGATKNGSYWAINR